MAIVSTSCGDNEKTPIGPSASFTISPLCDLVPAVELINTSQAHDGVLTLSVWSFSVSSMLTVILQ
ncbi:MAG: hypothetical protein JW841_12795 [Deltaproteobacteria bacterium]|nr:hypothetical protein [Deltaproteobacteria bacterium]